MAESVSQGEYPQSTDESENLHLQTEARPCMRGLGIGTAGPAQLPTGLLCVIHTTCQAEGAFTEMCIQGILLTGEDPGILKMFN